MTFGQSIAVLWLVFVVNAAVYFATKYTDRYFWYGALAVMGGFAGSVLTSIALATLVLAATRP